MRSACWNETEHPASHWFHFHSQTQKWLWLWLMPLSVSALITALPNTPKSLSVQGPIGVTAVGLNRWHRWLLTVFSSTNYSLLFIWKSVKQFQCWGPWQSKRRPSLMNHNPSLFEVSLSFVCLPVCACVRGHWQALTLTWMCRNRNHIISSLFLYAATALVKLTPKCFSAVRILHTICWVLHT